MPAISILMPSYNHAKFIEACLASVFAQSFADWELIAIDDGSTDASLEILSGFGRANVQVDRNSTNLGTYGTLKRALGMATGEYVAVLNSDDLWAKEKLERQLAVLERNPECGYCYTLGRRIDENGRVDEATDDHLGWPTDEVQELLPFLLEENRVLASSVLMRRPAADFLPDLRYSGDWVAQLLPARAGPAACVAERLTLWRMHSSNTFRRSAGQVGEEIRVRRSILARPRFWENSRAPVRRGLGMCAVHLSGLYALTGRMADARRAARLGAQLYPSAATLRRLAVLTFLPGSARKRLWETEPVIDGGQEMPLIDFSRSASALAAKASLS